MKGTSTLLGNSMLCFSIDSSAVTGNLLEVIDRVTFRLDLPEWLPNHPVFSIDHI